MLIAANLPRQEAPMAKTARKKSPAKVKKASRTNRPTAKAKHKAKAKPRGKPKPKAKSKRSQARKSQPKGIMAKVASAVQSVAEVMGDAQALRNKMEPPGTIEDG
jgi:hypothetical protein